MTEWQVVFPDGSIYIVQAATEEKAKALAIVVRKVDMAFGG